MKIVHGSCWNTARIDRKRGASQLQTTLKKTPISNVFMKVKKTKDGGHELLIDLHLQ